MKFKNIWRDVEPPLECHEDNRGKIVDIFYKNNIEHVAYITRKKGSVGGNHYHKYATQICLIVKGTMKYWYKPLDDANCESKFIILKEGDMVEAPPREIHAMEFLEEEDNAFICFAYGIRGGKDYESDTFRVDSIIIN